MSDAANDGGSPDLEPEAVDGRHVSVDVGTTLSLSKEEEPELVVYSRCSCRSPATLTRRSQGQLVWAPAASLSRTSQYRGRDCHSNARQERTITGTCTAISNNRFFLSSPTLSDVPSWFSSILSTRMTMRNVCSTRTPASRCRIEKVINRPLAALPQPGIDRTVDKL